MTQDDTLLIDLMKRIATAEATIVRLQEDCVETSVQRIKTDLSLKNVFSSVFVKVTENYYEKTLAMRAEILKCTIPQLCKSIIFENTAWVKDETVDLFDSSNSRFYLVVVQYQGQSTIYNLPCIFIRITLPSNLIAYDHIDRPYAF